MQNGKKLFTVLFSLLLVFLMIPAVPGTAYADSGMTAQEAMDKALANAEGFGIDIEKAVKAPMAEMRDAGEPMRAPGFAQRITNIDEYAAGSFVDSTFPTNGWIAIDNDGDGWSWVQAKEYYDGFKSLDGSDGESAASASYVNGLGELTPDNWLVSPAIKMPAGKQLQYFICGQDSYDYAEHYGVYVSTTSPTDPASFSLIYEETVDTTEFEGRTVDLSKYAGKNIYIAFRHFDCTDQYWFMLDGIGFSDIGSEPVPPEYQGERGTIIRVAGQNRYDTSLEAAKQLLWEADEETFPNAIIATGDNFADALAGSAVSIRTYAPILLISNKSAATIKNALDFIDEYVDEDGVVFILGGTGVVPSSVESELENMNRGYYRFSGKDRYDTNLQVLEAFKLEDQDNLLICDAINWPDAATASSTGFPMMLVGKNGLSDAQKAFLDSIPAEEEGAAGKLYFNIVGGTGAVTEAVEQDLLPYEASDEGVFRMAGANRAETAVLVAKKFCDEPQGATFAYASNYPDCIAGGFLSWFMDCPILYGNSNVPASYVAADAPYIDDNDITFAYILGGKSLIGSSFVADLFEPNLNVQ